MVALPLGAPALADPLFSSDDLHGYIDVRASAADGETSWLDRGLGVTPVNGAGGGFKGQAELAQSMIAWTPHLDFAFGAVVVGQFQPERDRSPSLGEAYLTWRSPPNPTTRISARAGLFYPPVSLEHDAGPFWIDRDMITPSAINSWIGEEVKVVAGELTVSQVMAGQTFTATGAVFGFNATAGTLLTFRGWGLGDITTGAPDRYLLPPLSAFMQQVQAPQTTPVFQIGGNPGAYARLAWKPLANLTFSGVYYDNRGQLGAVQDGQWAWRTRFWDAGFVFDFDASNHLLGQAMTGETRFALPTDDLVADTTFKAAYLRATHDFGRDALSARIDLFKTTDLADDEYGDTSEHGWALAADYRKRLSDHVDLLAEALHVHSDRPARLDILGISPNQSQTVLQISVRIRL
jgi:hypothetical protein